MRKIQLILPVIIILALLCTSCEESDTFTEDQSQGKFFRQDAPFFVEFATASLSYVELSILDANENLVLSIVADTLDAGIYEYSWSATEDMDDGIYALYLAAAGWTDERIFELDTRNISGQMTSYANMYYDETLYRTLEYEAGQTGGFAGMQAEWEEMIWEERLTFLETEAVQIAYDVSFKHDLPADGGVIFHSYIGSYGQQFGVGWDDWDGNGSVHLSDYQTMIGGASGWYE